MSGLKANELARLKGFSLQGLHGNGWPPWLLLSSGNLAGPHWEARVQGCRGIMGPSAPIYKALRDASQNYFSVGLAEWYRG